MESIPGTLVEHEGPSLVEINEKLDGLVTLAKAIENIVQTKTIPAPKTDEEPAAEVVADPEPAAETVVEPAADTVAEPEQVDETPATEDPVEEVVAELEKSADDPIAGALKLLKKREQEQEDRKSEIDHVALVESMSKLSAHVESMVGKLDAVKTDFGRACGKDV
jgi:tetrahydromethanopterin S-methyltransferase subunit B